MDIKIAFIEICVRKSQEFSQFYLIRCKKTRIKYIKTFIILQCMLL